MTETLIDFNILEDQRKAAETRKASLIDEQKSIVSSTDDNICIQAGPASGKTAVIECFSYKLLERGVSPDDILIFSFTNIAEDVLNNRIAWSGLQAHTIHGHGFRASNSGRQDFLKSKGEKFESLLKERQSNEKLYEWVICDEGQDLTETQYNTFLSWGKHHLLVGDTWQSIFRWSGAIPELLTRFQNDYCNRKYYSLSVNHRSAKSIVELSNKFSDRSLIWGEAHGEGKVQFVRNLPDHLENITILCRTNKEVEFYTDFLKSIGIAFTQIIRSSYSSGEERRVGKNYKEGKLVRTTTRKSEYLPTIVSTIHCAKGDEWSRVYLDYKDKYYDNPEEYYGLDKEEEDERRRQEGIERECCFYVGMTRAIEELYIWKDSKFAWRLRNA